MGSERTDLHCSCRDLTLRQHSAWLGIHGSSRWGWCASLHKNDRTECSIRFRWDAELGPLLFEEPLDDIGVVISLGPRIVLDAGVVSGKRFASGFFEGLDYFFGRAHGHHGIGLAVEGVDGHGLVFGNERGIASAADGHGGGDFFRNPS